MSDNALDTLFLPFEKDIIPYPAGMTLFMGARAHPALGHFPDLYVEQVFYPYFKTVQQYDSKQQCVQGYDAALCLVPKQKEEAQHDLAQCVVRVKEGGLIVAAASNDANGNRLEKWMEELGLAPQSLSKNKARACWAIKHGVPDTASAWIDAGRMRSVNMDGADWVSVPGMFGWNRIDAGSKLLTQHVPDDLSGTGADFGCGYGYLSRAVLARAGVTKLHGIDADVRAVACAKQNCADARFETRCADLSRPVDGIQGLDFIVMNPPFHEGKSTVPLLGRAFITTAAASLRRGGVLYMVANAHLDYEAILKTQFAHGDKLAETGGFKVFRAVK